MSGFNSGIGFNSGGNNGGTAATVKSGVIASGSFTGSPRTASVTFTTSFDDANYSVSISGVDERVFTVQSGQTSSGFTISTNSDTALSGNVYWTAIAHVDP